MPTQNHSKDIWDYLGDMPYLPSRHDRNELVAMAAKNPNHAKRPQIWDYFFHIRPEDVGKPQLQEIESLTKKKDDTLAVLRAKRKQLLTLTGGITVIMGVGSFAAFQLGNQPIELGLFGVFVLGLIVTGLLWQWRSGQITQTLREWNRDVTQLRKMIVMLQNQIPQPVTVDQVNRWLEEDIDWLSNHALEQTGLLQQNFDLDDGLPNPICIIGPAYLQRSKTIPLPFLDSRDPDRNKHIAASQLDFFSDKRFVDLYGVYYVEFIVVTEKVMGNYGCYWDFISGKIYNEHTSEIYYPDIVALTTRKHFHRVDLSFFKIVLENAPTFSISLANGETIQVTYASAEYIRKWHQILTQSPNGTFASDLKDWVRNPETIAEKAIKALRTQLRKYKGADANATRAESEQEE